MLKNTNWTGMDDEENSLRFACELAEVLATRIALDHPLSRAIANRDWEGVLRYEPNVDVPTEEYRTVVQMHALFKKATFLPVEVDTELAAALKFIQSERDCLETNTIFEAHASGLYCFRPEVERVLVRARQKIACVLGDVPQLEQLRIRFTSGASTSVKKKDATIRSQLMAHPACSKELSRSATLQRLVDELPWWFGIHVSDPCHLRPGYAGATAEIIPVEVHHAKLEFVPKTALTDRAIIVEPQLNKLLQLGYGDHMRERLRTVGIDLSTGQTLQRERARVGSLTGALATLDLSSASDLISSGLVMYLLPIDWFENLCDSRCGNVRYLRDGKYYDFELEKFSGMGNGYTFPLETLIFWAIVDSCVEVSAPDALDKRVTVYGDDIICPTEAVQLVSRVFTAVGFSLNASKSYWTGDFRESCGADWKFGKNVRPVYLRDRISLAVLFNMHNQFHRKGELDLAAFVMSWIPSSSRIFGPDGFGDGHLLGEWTPVPYNRTYKDESGRRFPNGGDLVSFKTWASVPHHEFSVSKADLSAILYMAYDGERKRYGCHERNSSWERKLLLHKLALEPGMDLSSAVLARSIKAARNAVMRDLLPDEVAPSTQRGSKTPSVLYGTTADDTFFANDNVVGMPLPGSEKGRLMTICTFRRS